MGGGVMMAFAEAGFPELPAGGVSVSPVSILS